MIVLGQLYPKTEDEIAVSDQKVPAPVDMTPWSQAKNASLAILCATIWIYLFLTWAAH